jgi:hypothetical protein
MALAIGGGVARLSEIRPGNASPVVVQSGPDLGIALVVTGFVALLEFDVTAITTPAMPTAPPNRRG